MIKGSIFQEVVTIPNVCTTNNTASNYIRHKLTELQGDIHEFTLKNRDFNIPESVINRFDRQKICKDGVQLNSTNQMDLIDLKK